MASVPAQPAMANARGRRSQQDVSGQETPAGTSALAQCRPTTQPWVSLAPAPAPPSPGTRLSHASRSNPPGAHAHAGNDGHNAGRASHSQHARVGARNDRPEPRSLARILGQQWHFNNVPGRRRSLAPGACARPRARTSPGRQRARPVLHTRTTRPPTSPLDATSRRRVCLARDFRAGVQKWFVDAGQNAVVQARRGLNRPGGVA